MQFVWHEFLSRTLKRTCDSVALTSSLRKAGKGGPCSPLTEHCRLYFCTPTSHGSGYKALRPRNQSRGDRRLIGFCFIDVVCVNEAVSCR